MKSILIRGSECARRASSEEPNHDAGGPETGATPHILARTATVTRGTLIIVERFCH